MTILWQYIKHYRKESILAPLFKLLEASFELAVPLVMASIIDTGIARRDTTYILQMCGVLIALGVVGLTASITAQYYAAKAATGVTKEIRHALFGKIQELSFSQLDLFGTDTMITRMTSDTNQVQAGFNMFLRLLLRSPFVVVGAMVMAFTVNVQAALVFVVTIPVLSAIIFWIINKTIPMYRQSQRLLDGLMTGTRENLTGVRVIRAFNREKTEVDTFHTNNEALANQQQFVSGLSGLMNPLTYAIINLAIVVLLWLGATQINTGILLTGQVVALVNYMSQILVELIKFANLVVQVSRSVASMDRISAILVTPVDMVDGHEPLTKDMQADAAHAVVFDHVSLQYESDSGNALEDISFVANKGQTIGIIGGTGSGKSSLVNLIPRFYDATQGEVRVFDQPVTTFKIEDLRQAVGVVLQKAELFRGTIADNLHWGNATATDAEMEQAIAIAQAKEYIDQKDGRLQHQIEQQGKNLSGGQKQRLTIARAIVKQPAILILDDSASALDFATDLALRKAIKTLPKDTTTFIVSQRAASIKDSDLILVMDEGRIVGQGTHDELLATNDIYQEIYASQFKKEEGHA